MKKYIILIAVLLFSGGAFAQQSWSLKDCIEYALKHNIQIQKQELANEQQKVELNSAKNKRLPDLSGSMSQDFRFGRATSPVDNSYVNKNSSNSSLGLNASVPIFTGFQIPNNIELSKLNLKAATEDLNKAREDISVNVTSAFLQVLFNEELCKVAKEQINLSKEQLDRITRMEEVGKASTAQVYEAKANLAQDELSAVQAENNRKLAILELTQLLELSTPEGFSIVSPEMEPGFGALSTPEDIYTQAIVNKPAVLAAQYRLQGMDKNIKIAQGAYYPTLSLNGSLGTGYYTMSGITSNGFGKQLNDNFNQYIGLSLSIPIFNRYETRNRIKTARLNYSTQALQVEESKKGLFKEIQQAYYNAVAAGAKFTSSKTAVEASEESFKLMRQKYENGKATSVEFNQVKMNLMKVSSDRIQAKYDYIFRTKILDFYKGVTLSL
ncbi:TolC family protein [uncultured Bacteroides sp.]|uniref:TolC family protein n=1 Tax=uncultured Bacteroides sp. TaxID=162156 RepID=UPI002AAAF8E6|nr:TolC family protein [uncultured Bacteroides sp.]